MFGTRCRLKMFNRLSCFPGFILRPWCNCLASLLPVVVVVFFKIGACYGRFPLVFTYFSAFLRVFILLVAANCSRLSLWVVLFMQRYARLKF